MKIIREVPKVTKFKVVEEDNIGTAIFQTQYGYRLTAPHPEDKQYFSCFSGNVYDALNGSRIEYDAEVHFQFDMEGKRPSSKDLLLLAQKAEQQMNQMLHERIQTQTKLNPIIICPINVEETLPSLEEAILLAYREN